MNLIQQLQQSPKWKEFEDWYNQYLVDIDSHIVGNLVHLEDIEKDNQEDVYSGCSYGVNFCFLPFEFQKGVFEKFIESKGFIIEQWYKTSAKQMYMCLFIYTHVESIFEGTFEELLIWYFNN